MTIEAASISLPLPWYKAINLITPASSPTMSKDTHRSMKAREYATRPNSSGRNMRASIILATSSPPLCRDSAPIERIVPTPASL